MFTDGVNLYTNYIKTQALTNLKVEQFACADYTSMMVNKEAAVLVAPGDIISKC